MGFFIKRLAAPSLCIALLVFAALPVVGWTNEKLVASELVAESKAGLLVLGDSISAAYGIDKSLGWVALLERRLAQQCPGMAVHNASVSGETTAGGLLRLPDLLARLKPALVVIELGGNDGLRGLSPAQMQRNFRDMISLARAADAEPVLLGILIPPNYGLAYRRLFEQAIADVAQNEQVALLDFFLTGVAEHERLMQEDGIHPTAEAQQQLLNNAMEVLEPLLRSWCGELRAVP
jgi:acyl-CoA thioesterase-1